MGIDSPVHLIFIGIVALLVLGPKRLPGVARALGSGLREFREAMSLDADHPVEHAPVVSHPVPDPAAPLSPGAAPPTDADPAAAVTLGAASLTDGASETSGQGDPLAASFEHAEPEQQG